MFASTYVAFDDTRRDYGERRIIAFACTDGIKLTVVFDRVDVERQINVASSVPDSVNGRSVVVMPLSSAAMSSK